MRPIPLHSSGGPRDASGNADMVWLTDAASLLAQLTAAPDKAARDKIIDENDDVWKRLRDWLLTLSHDKCWYSEARDLFSYLEVDHYRPKKRLKRAPKEPEKDGYWWLAFDWQNFRMCGKVGNAKKQDFFPLAPGSPEATHNGISIKNEIPVLLDPARPGDPELLTFNEDGAAVPHSDSNAFDKLRVEVTVSRLNLDHGRLKKARQRVWNRCRQLIEDCRDLALQMDKAPGPGDNEAITQKKAQLERMVRPEAEFSTVAKACLLKSNIGWAKGIACG
jgi:uncharacterized protein (TIGR02646 family)